MSLARSLLRFRNRNRMSPLRRNRGHFETLEPRILLSDFSYQASTDAAADLTLRIQKVDDVEIFAARQQQRPVGFAESSPC